MERHRALMMMPHGLDTSPIILQYGVRYRPRDIISSDSTMCITDKYDCFCDNNHRKFLAYGLQSTTLNYKSGEYYDYWNTPVLTPASVTIAKDGTEQMAFTLVTSMLDDCYVVQEGTGIILFAGKNSIYYGHRNISELN